MNNKICQITLFLLLLISCSFEHPFVSVKEISIVSWNVQTFFDANTDGIEYYEFRSKKSPWNQEMYEERLDKICSVVKKINSDVIVLQEIENEKIIYDIFNRLSNGFENIKESYKYSTFGKTPQSSIGIAVLSKHKIEDVKFHSTDIKTESSQAPDLRPIIEMIIDCGEKKIRLFANHWKSKSGGEENTDKWRKWQEKVLASIFKKDNANEILIATGDFNKDISEFNRDSNGKIMLNNFSFSGRKEVLVYSLWDECLLTNIGSYYFDGSWERIDHFFVEDKDVVKEFEVLSFQELTKDDGTPNRFELYKNSGYSDHLPIYCKIDLQ